MVSKDFTKQMSTFFKSLIELGFALVYIDDILRLSKSKNTCFNFLNKYILLVQQKQSETRSLKILLQASHSQIFRA